MTNIDSTTTAAESARDDGIALLATTAPEMVFAPAPSNELWPELDPDDRSLAGTIKSEFTAYDHFIDEGDGEWMLSFSDVGAQFFTIDEAKRYLAECAAVVRTLEMHPLPTTTAGAPA